MPRRREKGSSLEGEMQSAELRKHLALIARPHVAQEYRERGQYEHAESVCYMLTPHARMCAKGEVTQAYARRHGGKGKRYKVAR